MKIEWTITVGDILVASTMLASMVLWGFMAGRSVIGWFRTRRTDRVYEESVAAVLQGLNGNQNAFITVPPDPRSKAFFERMVNDGYLAVRGPGENIVGLPL